MPEQQVQDDPLAAATGSAIIEGFLIGSGSSAAVHPSRQSKDMKEGIHPAYRDVVFQDMASGFKFITRSTVNSREKIKMEDGKEYPLFKLDVTSESHPFYTGAQQRIIETGRVEKFRQKFARGGKATGSAAGTGGVLPTRAERTGRRRTAPSGRPQAKA